MKSMICIHIYIYMDKLQIQVEFCVLRKKYICKNHFLVYIYIILYHKKFWLNSLVNELCKERNFFFCLNQFYINIYFSFDNNLDWDVNIRLREK